MEYLEFNPLTSPLKGFNMIEASAGTGKTFSISILVLRALLDGVELKSILTVTFTQAATNELKDRIGKFINYASSRLKGESITDENKLIDDLLQNYDPTESEIILETAIRDYLKINIYTIHGFCNKLLNEFPIETDQNINSTLIPDNVKKDVILNIIYDFFRINLYNEDKDFLAFTLNKLDFTPENLIYNINNNLVEFYNLIKDNIKSSKDSTVLISSDIYTKQISIDNYIKDILHSKESISTVFKELLIKKCLNGNMYNPSKKLGKLLSFINAEDNYSISNFKNNIDLLELLTLTKITKAVKKNQESDFESIISQNLDFSQNLTNCEQLLIELIELDDLYIKKANIYLEQLLIYTGKKYSEFKQKTGYFDFGSIICDLHNELYTSSTTDLGNDYQMIFIDEFQDTDLWQFEIFKKLFFKDNKTIFFIGDPKQAIYSFRGADLAVYLNAKNEIKEIGGNLYSMKKNYRSSKEYICAMNDFYKDIKQPFNYQDVEYHQIETTDNSNSNSGLYCNFILPETTSKKLKLENENTYFTDSWDVNNIKAMVQELVVFIRNNSEIEIKNIAILVRTNKQCAIVANELTSYNIPVNNSSQTSYFETFEANQLFLLLQAVLYNKIVPVLKSGLYSELTTITKIIDDKDLNNYQNSFQYLKDIWQNKGLYAFYQEVNNLYEFEYFLAKFENGLSKLNNYQELIRILDEKSLTEKLTPDELLQLYYHKLNEFDVFTSPLEKTGLLLTKQETDENFKSELTTGIKVMTIHKSKGLEFDYVFCPFFEGKKPKEKKGAKFFSYFDVENKKTNFKFGFQDFDNKDKEILEKERISENLRMFYVALTRAKNGCYFFNSVDKSNYPQAMNYLIHNSQDFETVLENFSNDLKEISNKEYIFSNLCYPEKIDFTYSSKKSNDNSNTNYFKIIPQNYKISTQNTLTSYSNLVQNLHRNSTQRTRVDNNESNSFICDLYNYFKPGAESGNILHKIFEEISMNDLKISKDKLYSLIKDVLIGIGYTKEIDDKCLELVDSLLNKVHNKTLLNQIKLSNIDPSNLYHELEFYLRINSVSFDEIQNLFSSNTNYPIVEFQNGYLHGYIDLIVYDENSKKYFVIDWKSNTLGLSYNDYNNNDLEKTMTDSNYHLQYLLYCSSWLSKLFINKYGRKIIPEDRNLLNKLFLDSFGGVIYIFLRGVSEDENSKSGIYEKEASEIVTLVVDLLIKLQAVQRVVD